MSELGLFIELALLALALATALWLRPWRLFADGRLITPTLGTLALLPWLWALPTLHPMPLQLRWSGACLVVLLLGWPLAVPILILAALLTWVIAPAFTLADVIGVSFWQGLLPATLALALGAALRRLFGTHLFIYLLGRAFLGTVICIFTAGIIQAWVNADTPTFDSGLPLVARWLLAWGDGIVTGMIATLFVAFIPQWLATWSDALYIDKDKP